LYFLGKRLEKFLRKWEKCRYENAFPKAPQVIVGGYCPCYSSPMKRISKNKRR
jgi:hypothetical protein